jgi:hypothetical protein
MDSPPPVLVREALERARSAGVDFTAAWPAALEAVTDEHWLDALASTAKACATRYDREPATAPDLAVDLLARGDAGELVDLNGRPHCLVCDTAFDPPPRGREKLYCGRSCQRIANGRREQLAA